MNVAPPVQTNANFGPVTTILDSRATAGNVDLVGNLPTRPMGTTCSVTQMVPFAVPYPYTADSAASAEVVVPHCVGPGHIMVPPAN